MITTKVFSVILTVIAFASTCYGISCYQGTASVGVTSLPNTNCTAGPVVCSNSSVSGSSPTYGCGPTNQTNPGCVNITGGTACYCAGDGCNVPTYTKSGSGHFNPASTALVVLFLTLMSIFVNVPH